MIQSVTKQYIPNTTNFSNQYLVVFIDGTKSYVPHDEGNRHYQEILEWVADGNTITDNGGSN
jgi:hypothetical protein